MDLPFPFRSPTLLDDLDITPVGHAARALARLRALELFAWWARADGQHPGQMAPVATGGRLVGVVALGDGTEYPAKVDPATGAFYLAVPPGMYQLKFTTAALSGASQPFPREVTVPAVAGTTVTPAVPPITHDGIGRGRLRWTLDGRQYTARAFIKGYGEGKYFNWWGRSEELGPASEVKEVSLVLPQATEKGPLFAGAGTYPLGGAGGWRRLANPPCTPPMSRSSTGTTFRRTPPRPPARPNSRATTPSRA